MTKLKCWTTLFCVFCLSGGLNAQAVTQDPVVLTITAGTEKVGCPLLHIRNVSKKDITGYVVTVLQTKQNGETEQLQYSADFVPQYIAYKEQNKAGSGWLQPSQENLLPVACQVDGTLVTPDSLRARLRIVLFTDGTMVGEEEDDSLPVFASFRLRVAEAERRMLAIVNQRLGESNKTSSDLFSNVSNDISQLIQDSDLEGQHQVSVDAPSVTELSTTASELKQAVKSNIDAKSYFSSMQKTLAERMSIYTYYANQIKKVKEFRNKSTTPCHSL